jgi:3-oxoacyl-[acyl-carrier-protein] synthase II
MIKVLDWAVQCSIATQKGDFETALGQRQTGHGRMPISEQGRLDRLSTLAVSTADQLLNDHLSAHSGRADHTAVVLGTSTGSLPRLVEMTSDSLRGRTGYDVRPSSIPSMVPNAAAGQIAIRHRISGPNTTVAAAHLSGLVALSVASRFLALGHADFAVAGAVEELSPERQLGDRVTRSATDRAARPAGEGCALMLLGRTDDPHETGLLGVRYGSSPGASPADQQNLLTLLIRELLDRHQVEPTNIGQLSLGQYGSKPLQDAERAAIDTVIDRGQVPEIAVADLIGDTHSTAAAFQVAAALALGRRHSLITALGTDGEVAAALLRHGEEPR